MSAGLVTATALEGSRLRWYLFSLLLYGEIWTVCEMRARGISKQVAYNCKAHLCSNQILGNVYK
jgi:hypothetical protein